MKTTALFPLKSSIFAGQTDQIAPLRKLGHAVKHLHSLMMMGTCYFSL